MNDPKSAVTPEMVIAAKILEGFAEALRTATIKTVLTPLVSQVDPSTIKQVSNPVFLDRINCPASDRDILARMERAYALLTAVAELTRSLGEKEAPFLTETYLNDLISAQKKYGVTNDDTFDLTHELHAAKNLLVELSQNPSFPAIHCEVDPWNIGEVKPIPALEALDTFILPQFREEPTANLVKALKQEATALISAALPYKDLGYPKNGPYFDMPRDHLAVIDREREILEKLGLRRPKSGDVKPGTTSFSL